MLTVINVGLQIRRTSLDVKCMPDIVVQRTSALENQLLKQVNLINKNID